MPQPTEPAKRRQIALLFYSTVNLVVFTAAVYAVTMFPPLTPNAGYWLAGIVAASLLVTAPVARCIGVCFPPSWRKTVVAEPSPLAHEPTRPV